MIDPIEREIDALEGELERGEITQQEFDKLLNEIHRDAQAELEGRAWDAYNEVMEEGRW